MAQAAAITRSKVRNRSRCRAVRSAPQPQAAPQEDPGFNQGITDDDVPF